MNARDGWYDPAVLSVIEHDTTAFPLTQASAKIVAIPFSDLKSGLTLAAPIETIAGRRLIDAGTMISDALLIRLRKHAEANTIKEPIEIAIHA